MDALKCLHFLALEGSIDSHRFNAKSQHAGVAWNTATAEDTGQCDVKSIAFLQCSSGRQQALLS
jgi:hypothetical protein